MYEKKTLKFQPEKFTPAEKLEPLGIDPRQITFLDCSCFYKICPFGAISFRQILRKCCPFDVSLHTLLQLNTTTNKFR